MIKGILFDYDDTLSDRKESAYLYYRAIMRRLFPALDPKGAEFEAVVQRCMIWDEFGNVNKAHVFQCLKDKYLPDLDVEEEVSRWYAGFAQYQVVQPEAYHILDDLQKKYELGVISNGKEEPQNEKIDVLGLRHYFKTVLVSEGYGEKKPGKNIFLQAAKDLNLECSEIAFIGDTFPTDILGAIRAGMMPIWFSSRREGITIYPIIQLHSFTEIEDMFLKDTAWNR